MSAIEDQMKRVNRLIRILAWIVAVGALFDLWEFYRLFELLRSWGRV